AYHLFCRSGILEDRCGRQLGHDECHCGGWRALQVHFDKSLGPLLHALHLSASITGGGRQRRFAGPACEPRHPLISGSIAALELARAADIMWPASDVSPEDLRRRHPASPDRPCCPNASHWDGRFALSSPPHGDPRAAPISMLCEGEPIVDSLVNN